MKGRAFLLVFLMAMAPYLSTIDVVEATSGRAMACAGNVCLNEALPNPNGYDDAAWPGGEWMEIYNSGSTAVNVLNWQLENKASKTLDFDSTSIVGYEAGNSSTWTIEPGDYMVIARNGTPSSEFYLTNTFDYITMKDASGNVVDQASWNTSSSGVSLEEDSNNPTSDWISTNTPTPGSANSASAGTVPSDLRITEVMANPFSLADNGTWPDGEWIEIWNSGQADIDLTGWSIVDNAGNIIQINQTNLVGSSLTISPDEYRVFSADTGSGWSVLNNGGESLRLVWPNGTTSQTISWSSTTPGYTLSEQIDLSWDVSSYPTPEASNAPYWDAIVTGNSPIKISEVLVNSTYDGAPLPDGEWIEIHNTGNNDFDLMGWKIKDGMGNITLLDQLSLKDNASQPGTLISADGRRLVQFFGDIQLWNSFNYIMLLDQFDNVVHKSWWTADPGLNVSLIEPSDILQPWVPSSYPTPGQPEPSNVPVFGNIAFNEILPDAVGNDTSTWPNGEWIELKNIGNQSVDIANWHFTSGSRNFNINPHQMPFKSDTVIQPGEVFVVAINGSQGFYLKNTNPDTIELRDSSNQLISSITYNSSTEGESNWFWNGDWSQAPWTTPGEENPQTSPYSGATTIEVTEILAYCSDGSISPLDDWVEVFNNGSEVIDLSAWRMISEDGDLIHLRPARLWNSSSMEIQPGERLVFTMQNWFLSGLGDSLFLEDPDGNNVDFVGWNIVTDCKTISSDGQALPWPTPGEEEPDSSSFAAAGDLIFSRFMFEEKSETKNDEFFEITNTGNLTAVLNGWSIRKTTTGGITFNGTFTSGEIMAGASVIISPDASAVKAMGATLILDADDVMNYPVWMPNSGAAMQLVSPDGDVADTFVYGNGPTDLQGWNGPAIAEPVTSVDRILYLRGDGCGDMPDMDNSNDWQSRWSVAGASHFCGINSFSQDSVVTPLIGPEYGYSEVLNMIDSANISIHLHIYQLHHTGLAQALIDASLRGVEVIVVIHEPEDWWGDYSVGQSNGIAWELENAGAEVMQFTSSSSSPYQYIHSKIAVVDSNTVWLGSGNWKESSIPSDGSGNRDWGVIVESTDLASIVLERMEFDEDPSQLHVVDKNFLTEQPEQGSYNPPVATTGGDMMQSISGPISGELLTCPDDCMEGLAQLISSADSEILLSLQYFEMDWYWGWQENPLLDELESAAQRGVSIRLAINQHYVNDNPGIREAVNELNQWEGDVQAILMSENETVTKLHNKGVIIDGESVLISSINWGDNSILRNREMGLIIHSQAVTSPYYDSFWEDWNRFDDNTDTDIDGIPDYWEVENGLSRTDQDSLLDSDNDGITNIGEFSYSSNPNSPDTDADCILDSDEILWATSNPNVTATDALNLADADGDGIDDYTIIGCVPNITQEDNTSTDDNTTNDDNQTTQEEIDSDNDGLPDLVDECPDTELGVAIDSQGCSNEQNKQQSYKEEEESSSGMTFMLILIVGAVVVLIGAATVLLRKEKPGEETVLIDSEIDKNWEAHNEDSQSDMDGPDMSKFPGWTRDQVEKYLDAGWTEEQLAEWYQQQKQGNNA